MSHSPPDAVPEHRYRGARALVRLHAAELERFAAVWRLAHEADLALPETDDPDYASLEHVLHHVLACARHYVQWICEQLELPIPPIESPPAVETLPEGLETYLSHLFQHWRSPLADVAPERFGESYASRWKSLYSIDGMLEHAVMHPLRHRLQLEDLLGRTPADVPR